MYRGLSGARTGGAAAAASSSQSVAGTAIAASSQLVTLRRSRMPSATSAHTATTGPQLVPNAG